MKHSVDMSLPRIGEDFSLLDTIIAELPELFYAEIFPKLDSRATLNLAQVSKTWRDAVWSVDGVRSMEANIYAYNSMRTACFPYWYPRSFWVSPMARLISLAVWHGNVPAVRALLKSGVDVNKRVSSTGVTMLCFAAYEGHLSIVALLLDAGANARVHDSRGDTPLNDARQRGHKKVVELLKAAGA